MTLTAMLDLGFNDSSIRVRGTGAVGLKFLQSTVRPFGRQMSLEKEQKEAFMTCIENTPVL